jgi:dihydrolipoamide dehydrogenase
MSEHFDVVVIGGGPGGYVAAIRAAQLGMKAAVVEETHLGGICLNWGCIPTKALLRSSEILGYLKHAELYGLKVSNVSFDLDTMVKRSRTVSAQLSKGVEMLLKKNKVKVFSGRATLKASTPDKKTIEVTKDGKTDSISSKFLIIATGARARTLPHIPASSSVWSYREAMVPSKLPKSMVVIGSGAIGMEFASFFNALGTKVTVVEMVERILPAEDEEISDLAAASFTKQGMTLLTSSTVEAVEASASGHRVSIKTGDTMNAIDTEVVLVAVGIVPNTENLGLETTRIQLDRGHIVTNGFAQTHEQGIYAIGDVTGAPWLAHKASHEGILAVEHMAGHQGLHALSKNNIPGCTYTSPQVASVGLTESQARDDNREIRVGRFPFMGNGKAIALGEPEGLVKTIFDAKTGELLGAHMIGAEVTELIQGFVIGKVCEATEETLASVIFPHPTLSEMMHESVLSALGRAIHI